MSVISSIKGLFSDEDENSGENEIQTSLVSRNADARQNQQGLDSYTYPPEIFSTDYVNNFLVMRRLRWAGTAKNYHSYSNYRRAATTNDSNSDFITMSYLNLYMPTMVDQIDQNYEDAKISLAADVIGKATDIYQGKGTSNMGNVAKELIGVYAGAAAGGVANLASNAIQQSTNTLISNPVAGSYTGPSRRSQTMKFVFAPRNLSELNTVSKIIKEFYRGALTSDGRKIETGDTALDTGANYALLAYRVPDVWYLEEVSNTNFHKYLPRFIFGPAAITSLKLNKTPDDYWMTLKYTAGDPAVIELEVTFQELSPYTLETFENDIESDVQGYTGDQTTLRG